MATPRSAVDWFVDATLTLSALGIGAAVLIDTWDEHAPAVQAIDVVIGTAALVALGWRRRFPNALGVAAALASIASAFAAGPALVAAFNVAVRGTRRGLLATAGISVLAVFVFPALYPPADGYLLNVVVGALLTAVVFGWGLVVRTRREQDVALRDRAVEDARAGERRRIAREMHDVLAHRLSLLALHAGALEYRGEPGAAVIRETARAALEDLRAVIGVLRDGDGEAVTEPPQPTLGDLGDLVEESRAAGMRVEVSVTAADLPAGLGRTAYRIVQEGLTNARKHAPGAAVDVRVDGEDELRVTVRCRRPVGLGAATLPGAGSGLVGLEERVGLAGGTLRAGWVGTGSAGDFVLDARLPWSVS